MSDGFREAIREKLAALEHEQWSELIDYLIRFAPLKGGPGAKDFWERYYLLSKIPYEKLEEKQKDSDRRFADKVLAVVLAEYTKELQQELDRLRFYTAKSTACTSCDWSFDQKNVDDPHEIFMESVKHALTKHPEGSEKLTIHALREEIKEQKKLLQALFDEMPVYKSDDAYNLQLWAWLKKVKDSGLVELSKL